MLTRRTLLSNMVGTGLALAAKVERSGAQTGRRRMIVDAQVHLWKAESEDWRWVPGAVPQLPEPFTIEKLVPLMDEAGVDRAVIVPPGWPGDRNDYGLEAAKRYPDRFAVMGRIPLRDPRSAALLPKWKEQPNMLGVRVAFLNNAADWISDGTADWFWPAAEKASVPVMAYAPGRAPLFAAIAERHPGLNLIIDHMNVSAQMARDNQLANGIDQTVALAKYPNVSVKVSSSPGLSFEPYPFRDVAVHLRRVIEAFTPQRAFWGTDLTNSYSKATYRQRVTQFTETLQFLNADELDLIMGRAILARLGWI
jgi:predicted TIM-barrel fold metal-dependent hydrolase